MTSDESPAEESGVTDEDSPGADVLVVYDSDDEQLRRTCFWQYLEDDPVFDSVSFDYISISESIEARENPATRLFSRNAPHDLVIVNWDAINTDIVYGSRDSLNFIEHYIPDLDRWVRAGNVVLVEEQSTASIPIQQAYEPFTYDGRNMQKTYPLTVERASRWEEDLSRTYRTLEDDGHPIVETTGETLSLGDASIYRKDWFPPQFTKDLASLDDYETLKQRMYIGWFDNYDDAWIPLVFADQERTRPTLLCRFVEGDDAVGAYVVSTMYLGAAEQTELVRNMLDIPEHGPGYLKRLEEESRERKRTILLRSALAVGTVIAVAVFILAYRLYGFTPTGLIGSMISGAVSALVYVSVERRLSAR